VPDYCEFMKLAIEEAEVSLREGNSGFGAIIVQDRRIIAESHDTEKTDHDPTAHAELTAIRKAASLLGGRLDGCLIISTHEPCPMCATAIVWSGIKEVGYGYSIKEALEQGRNRIDLTCREIFLRAGKSIPIHEGLLHDRCSVLYDRKVREQIGWLRDADEHAIRHKAAQLTAQRLAWCRANQSLLTTETEDVVGSAYKLLLRKLDLSPEDAPILERSTKHFRFASRNFCPTLEACRILGLDTRIICRILTEGPTNEFLRQMHPGLRFSRNYEALRPHGDYCEETISLVDY
jgi:tRNA(adenine34) deaminase